MMDLIGTSFWSDCANYFALAETHISHYCVLIWDWLKNGLLTLPQMFGWLMIFAFYYPLIMAYMWIVGGILYYFRWERREAGSSIGMFTLTEYPPISILVPCHNESYDIEETIEYLLQQDYPDFEIIAINDGSKDNTLEILLAIAAKYPCVRVINLEQNQGKATALNMAAMASKSEFLICIDGDALLDKHVAKLFIHHFRSSSRVGAVTGNPRIRTRSTMLGKIQVGEFSAIVGLIKRSQHIYGRIFTVSGVVCGFRKAALHRVGYWSTDMITEDIDITCKLQMDHWDVRYEPRALCWILMPETWKGLWSQRRRWAQGGAEVLIKHFKELLTWKSRRMLPIYLEYFISVFWAYIILIFSACWVVNLFIPVPDYLQLSGLYPKWSGLLLGITCLMQFAVSLMIDSRYEKGMGREYYWIIWYPIAYWVLNVLAAVFGFYLAVKKNLSEDKHKLATWTSPDRGIH